MLGLIRLLRRHFTPLPQWPCDWRKVRRFWQAQRQVDWKLIGPAARRARGYILVERIAAAPDAEDVFWSHLDDPDPVVAGYCLSGLELLESPLLAELPVSLKSREEVIRLLHCCFGADNTLGSHAKSVEERWRESYTDTAVNH